MRRLVLLGGLLLIGCGGGSATSGGAGSNGGAGTGGGGGAAAGTDGGAPDGDVDAPPSSTSPAVPLRAKLEVSPQLAPGQPLHIVWSTTGKQETQTVSLRLHAPGGPATPTSAGYLFTGSAPAIGEARWVASDKALSEAKVSFSTAASGVLDLPLPSSLEGDWAVDLFVFDADGRVATFTSATAWIATGPTLRLDLSRNWAAPGDVIDAAVTLRGTAAEPLRLSAWLTLPDDRVVTVPSMEPAYLPIAEGQLSDRSITLLSSELGQHGAGRYGLSIKLETLDGKVRARAGAEIQICSAPGTFEGVISDGTRTYGDGVVQAISAGGRIVSGSVDATGKFSLAVPAGRHVLFARGNGWSAGAVGEVGCAKVRPIRPVVIPGSPVTAQLMAGGVEPAFERRRSALTPVQAEPPHVMVDIAFDPMRVTGVFKDLGEFAFFKFEDWLKARAPGRVTYYMTDILKIVATWSTQAETMNSTTAATLSEIVDAIGILDAEIVVSASRAGAKWELHGEVHKGNEMLRAVRKEVTLGAAEAVVPGDLDKLERTGKVLAEELAEGLAEELEARREIPRDPVLTLSTPTDVYAPGASIPITATVAEKATRALVLAPDLSILVYGPDLIQIATLKVENDGMGRGSVSYTPPPGLTHVVLQASLKRMYGLPKPSQYKGVVIRPTILAVSSPKGMLKPTETAPVTVRNTTGNGFTLSAKNGSSDATTLMFDSDARATFQFIAGPVEGPAAAIVNFFMQSSMISTALPFYVVMPVLLTAELQTTAPLINNQLTLIRGSVTRNGVPVPNLAVSVIQSGDGTLGPATPTSANGSYVASFRAPASGMGTTTVKVTVFYDGAFVSKEVMIAYGPACASCPVIVDLPSNPVLLKRGAKTVFAANQAVTWKVEGDASITSDGELTARQTGGVVLVTATAVTDSTNKYTFPVIVECTVDEILGTFEGPFMPSGTPLTPYDCGSTATVRLVLGPYGIPPHLAYFTEASLRCGATGQGVVGGLASVSLAGCSAGGEDHSISGCPSSTGLSPDLTHVGMTHREAGLIVARILGVCTTQVAGKGILVKQ